MTHIDLEAPARKFCAAHSLTFAKRVGEGSFKETFQVVARDGTDAALKIYKPGSSHKRDRREVDAMRRCSHTNIARLLDIQNLDYRGQKYVVVLEEFLAGGTLTAKGVLAVTECFRIGKELIDAIAHIAERRLVHRDIKPDNILFRAGGVVPVLTDFGVARDLADSSITPTWAPRGPGTPFFAAPEQLNNEKALIDWRSDQFALGIALAYQTFSSHPYQSPADTDGDVVENVAAREGPCPTFVSAIEMSGLQTLLKMVAPWPVDRYRTPGLLAAAWQRQGGR